MLDYPSWRNCIRDAATCDGWIQPPYRICPGDCPYRMSALTDDSPEEVKAISDIWVFTREMLLVPQWTKEQADDVSAHLDEWRDTQRDENLYADGCMEMLGQRFSRWTETQRQK